MTTERKLLFLFLMGSIWGVLEVLLWDLWQIQGWAHPEIVLAGATLLCLAAARRVVDVPGSSVAIAGVAILYKTTSIAFFACQITAVLCLAVAFEVAALVTANVMSRESSARPLWMGATTIYPAFAAFALLTTFVFEGPNWVGTGWTKILPYLGWGAVASTILAAAAAVVGWRLGARLFASRPVTARVMVPAAVILWCICIVHAVRYAS